MVLLEAELGVPNLLSPLSTSWTWKKIGYPLSTSWSSSEVDSPQLHFCESPYQGSGGAPCGFDFTNFTKIRHQKSSRRSRRRKRSRRARSSKEGEQEPPVGKRNGAISGLRGCRPEWKRRRRGEEGTPGEARGEGEERELVLLFPLNAEPEEEKEGGYKS
ncbi:hypothetical protein KM043_005413 [Ampulex compressa]|nr:hypothetical protein KM043_005413 [Ampulex compressa]